MGACLVDECMLDGHVHTWWMGACLVDERMLDGHVHSWLIVCMLGSMGANSWKAICFMNMVYGCKLNG